MKKIQLVFRFVTGYLLQILLAIVAFDAYQEVLELGYHSSSEIGKYSKYVEHEEVTYGTSVAMSAGFNGGALSMGIICGVCIVMIVWIEISKKQKLN